MDPNDDDARSPDGQERRDDAAANAELESQQPAFPGEVVVAASLLAGVIAGTLVGAKDEHRAIALPPQHRTLPFRVDRIDCEIDYTDSTPVTERPERITYLWCYRFYRWTNARDRLRLVRSASSRSQYDRIAKQILRHWGDALDQRATTFERLRWIAASDDFAERQARYLRIVGGERPRDLKAALKAPDLTTRLLRPARKRRRPTGTGDVECERRKPRSTCLPSRPREAAAARSALPGLRRTHAGRQRGRGWEPATPRSCYEAATALADQSSTINAMVEELCRRQGVPFKAVDGGRPCGASLPPPTACPPPWRRRRTTRAR